MAKPREIIWVIARSVLVAVAPHGKHSLRASLRSLATTAGLLKICSSPS